MSNIQRDLIKNARFEISSFMCFVEVMGFHQLSGKTPTEAAKRI